MHLQTFTAPTGVQLRTVEQDGQIYFVGKDAAEMLGYSNHRKAINDHCRGVTKRYPIVDALGRTQEIRIISEPDLYRLIVNSKLPAAQEYESWVFEEVLPAIRKQGGYMVDIAKETPEETLARALRIANDTMERQKARLAALENQTAQQQAELAQQDITIKTQQTELAAAAPKCTFADAVAQSDNCILVGELAKILRQNGIEIGMTRLFRWLRENKYLMKDNRPTQRSMEKGLFRVIERPILDGRGFTRLTLTTKVTGKGQQYFINLFLNKTA